MTRERLQKFIASLPTHAALIGLMLLWLLPTIGLLVTSFRPPQLINQTGWWTALGSQAVSSGAYGVYCADCHGADGALIASANLTDPEVISAYSRSTRLLRLLRGEGHPALETVPSISEAAEITDSMASLSSEGPSARFTPSNYADALFGYRGTTSYSEACASGTAQEAGLNCNFSDILNPRGMGRAFLNSLLITIPATILPILVAAFAAYAFSWLDFKGRYLLFALLVGLQVVPLQMTLVPISRVYAQLGLNGTFLGVWLFHTGFGLPYAIYLLRNFLGGLPRDLFESAYLDGADHWTAFTRLALPLAMPAIASLAIFQFLWVWNDLLVALIFLGADNPVVTYQIGNMVTSKGAGWHLLTAAAFISMILPMIVFFSMQRFFVRGLLAGSVKG
jgi:alpha-glucoside transport system permease protein